MNRFSNNQKNYVIQGDNNFFNIPNKPMQVKAIPLKTPTENFFEINNLPKQNQKTNLTDFFNTQNQNPKTQNTPQTTRKRNYTNIKINIKKAETPKNFRNHSISLNNFHPNNPQNPSKTQNLLPLSNFNDKLSIRSNRSSKSQKNNPLFNNQITPTSRKSLISPSRRLQHKNLKKLQNLPDSAVQLKTIILSKEAEIRYLKEKENGFHEGKINSLKIDDLSYKINKLEIEMINLKNINIKMKRNVEKYRFELGKIEGDLKKEHDLLERNFERNQTENYDMMEKEMTFNYKGNDGNTIEYLKRKLNRDKSLLEKVFN